MKIILDVDDFDQFDSICQDSINREIYDSLIEPSFDSDKGDEFLRGKIYLNESKKENKISSGFFLPVIKDFSICLAGSGEMCNVKSFYCETEYKQKYINNDGFQPRGGCDCCLVF